jgi:hypothetical protein
MLKQQMVYPPCLQVAPPGVTKAFVEIWGAGGGGGGGDAGGGGGGFTQGWLATTPGKTYYIMVGEGGVHTSGNNRADPTYGGGGRVGHGGYEVGMGGGRSAIRDAANDEGTELATAGGGGGGGEGE